MQRVVMTNVVRLIVAILSFAVPRERPCRPVGANVQGDQIGQFLPIWLLLEIHCDSFEEFNQPNQKGACFLVKPFFNFRKNKQFQNIFHSFFVSKRGLMLMLWPCELSFDVDIFAFCNCLVTVLATFHNIGQFFKNFWSPSKSSS